MANFAAQMAGIEDFLIGDADENGMSMNRFNQPLDDDDFILGESNTNETKRYKEPPEGDQNNSLLGDMHEQSLDFLSINDLIDSELQAKKSPQMARVQDLEPQPAKVEVLGSQSMENQLGEDYALVEDALKICERIQIEIQKLKDVERFKGSEKNIILNTLHNNQKTLREHHHHIQTVISQLIREGNIQRVNRVDQAKRKIDDALLQIRALENRITNRGVGVVAGSYIDGSSAQDIYREAENRPVLETKKRKAKRKAKAHSMQSTRANKRGRGAKIVFILLLLFSMPFAYHLSANWGVQKSVVVNTEQYEKVIPMIQARGVGKGFNGIVYDSWQTLGEAEKVRAVRQLASMIKIEGYDTIFLTYESQGMAAIYSAKNNKVIVK